MSRDRTCQKCGALPGKQCLTAAGKLLAVDHVERAWDRTRSPNSCKQHAAANRDRYARKAGRA